MNKVINFLKKTMGSEALESLLKYDVYSVKTNTVISDKEIFNALQVVPAAVLAFLKKELIPMKEGESKDIPLPVDGGAILSITKHAMDVYSGNIHQKGKVLNKIKFRPIPSIGLSLLSTFELYDAKNFGSSAVSEEDKAKVADKVERAVNENNGNIKANAEEDDNQIKPLKNFLKSKMEKREFAIVNLTKSDSVNCPDCDQQIVGNGIFSACVCLGSDMKKKVYLVKSEGKTVLRFSKGWDSENIKMVLEALHNRKKSNE